MIHFQSERFDVDLTSHDVSLIEENDIFNDSINRNYSLPFLIKADAVLLEKLGLPSLENIRNVDVKIIGRLLLPENHYPSILYLGEVTGDFIESEIKYGPAEISIYSTKLKDLPWPTIICGNIIPFAENIITKSWPETGYNFPMVFKPSIQKDNGYERFGGFVNHYEAGFFENLIDITGEEPVIVNRNVMVPFPYLLEIVKFGYKCAGRNVAGSFFQNDKLKKAVYIPENYLERLDGSQYLKFSFGLRTGVENVLGEFINIYENSFIPQAEGEYELKFKINLSPVMARFFNLSIYRENALSGERTLITKYESVNNRVSLDEKLTIAVANLNVLDPFIVSLKISYTDINIAEFNDFEISFGDGSLNVFPTYFSLADFMPDLTFGEFMNKLKNWLNLDTNVTSNVAIINFLEETILERPRIDHTHLETPKPKRTSNITRFYKLKYADGSELNYNRNGQAFSDIDEDENNIITIDMGLQLAIVEKNKGFLTAVAPDNSSDLDICLYGGLINGVPLCDLELSTALSLQNVFLNWWQQWLYFRINGYTFKENIECAPDETYSINDLIYKFNELHIPKKITKKYKSEEVMKVDIETETF